MAEKACSKCGTVKPIDEFGQSKRTKDGRKGQCKECVRAYKKKWQRENPEKNAAQTRRYRARHADANPRRDQRYKELNPEKKRAHAAVQRAVHYGRMVKPNRCEDCEVEMEKSLIHGHHEDYSKPLEVRWLCKDCHTALHRREREEQLLQSNTQGGED